MRARVRAQVDVQRLQKKKAGGLFDHRPPRSLFLQPYS